MLDPVWKDVSCKGEITKQNFSGRFYLKPYLTHEERADAKRLAEMYCRGLERSQDQILFLTTLAFLKFHVIETDADWFKKKNGLDLHDEDPIFEISKMVAEVQESYNPKPKSENNP